MADPRQRTDSFRYNPRAARLGVVALALLLLATGAAVLVGPGFRDGWTDRLLAALAGLVLAVPLAAFVWVARRRPVVLRIGPEGLDMPIGFARPLAWADIHRIRLLPEHRGLLDRRQWLVVDPAPGVLPDWRLSGPRRAEMWLMPRLGLRIPLHALDAPAATVIASFERFRPVQPPR